MSVIAVPELVLSGQKAKPKSLPALRPLSPSKIFLTKPSVVPGGTVLSKITRDPFCKLLPIVLVTALIAPKSGLLSDLTKVGTIIKIISAYFI